MEKNKTENLLLYDEFKSDDELKNDEKTLIEWYRNNPLSVYIEIALMAMADIGIMSENDYHKYKAQAEANADVLREYLRKGGDCSSWTRTH